jgi:hypothetical protein
LENKTISFGKENSRCETSKEDINEGQSFQYTSKDIEEHRLGKYSNLPLVLKEWKMEA